MNQIFLITGLVISIFTMIIVGSGVIAYILKKFEHQERFLGFVLFILAFAGTVGCSIGFIRAFSERLCH